MKNINAYGSATMVGKRWVATPFVLNYGFDTFGFEDCYLEWDVDAQSNLNYFGMSKRKYFEYIKSVASPSYYGSSFRCGDMGYSKYGANNRETNMIQLLFDDAKLRIASIWFDKTNRLPNTEDYNLIGLVNFDKELFDAYVKHPILISCDVMLFKYTMQLYEDLLYLRFDKNFGKGLQYDGVIRFDSGDTRNFSAVHCTMKLEDELAISCINKLRILEF